MDETQFLLREKYNGKKTLAYEADLKRLAEGEPLGYVIGFVPFLDCRIYLDSHPLIPRPETEYWVEKAIAELSALGQKTNINILDLFAGSGCIGVAALKHIQDSNVDFGEIEKKHLPTIRKNIIENTIDESRMSTVETDVFSRITRQYDAIFANPPYLTQSRIERIGDSVLAHEPKEALFAEEDGFGLIRKTIEDAPAHLNPKGILYIEHEPEHAKEILRLSIKVGFEASTYPDQYGVLRYSVLRKALG